MMALAGRSGYAAALHEWRVPAESGVFVLNLSWCAQAAANFSVDSVIQQVKRPFGSEKLELLVSLDKSTISSSSSAGSGKPEAQ